MRVGQGTHGGEARLGARPALGPHQIVRAVAARSKTVDRPGRCRFITFGVMWGGETCPNQTPPPGDGAIVPAGGLGTEGGWHRVSAPAAIKAKRLEESVSNASHMKVAQKPRGTARFRRYELVSVCGIWQWRRHSCLLSPLAFFGVSILMCALLSVRTGVLPCRHDPRPHHSFPKSRSQQSPLRTADQDLGDVGSSPSSQAGALAARRSASRGCIAPDVM
jgi:hypothetical protein